MHVEKLHAINAQDPAEWNVADVVQLWQQFHGPEYGLGIVLWKGCGLFCLDIDKALLEDGTWSPVAQELCARFKGAYQEVSHSGRGIHIFASYRNEVPPHKKRNTQLHLELYDELRFIGVTGTNTVGDENYDATGLLPHLIGQYFPPGVEATSDGWTTEPAPEWSGPADDDVLIAKMLNSRSVRSIFGSGAHVRDLWSRNVPVLAQHFPPQSEGKEYDGSSADQALANHLSFWTGGNCERIFDLMQRSELKREKWDREGYLRSTIANAVSGARKFLKISDTSPSDASPPPDSLAPPPPPPPPSPVGAPMPPNAPPATPVPPMGHGDIVTGTAQATLFQGVVYVQDMNQIMVSEGHSLKKEPFDNDRRYRGRTYVMSRDGQKTTGSAWEAVTQSQCVEFDMVRGTFFDPQQAEGARETRNSGEFVNTWRDPQIRAEPGDVSLYTDHIKKLFPEGDDALIYTSYVAACVQHLGYKAAWALFIQGTPGNGKSFLTKVMRYCFGKEYVHAANASNLDNRFNGYLYRKLMILVEEIKTVEGNAHIWEKLKTMITEKEQEIEAKGVDQVTREVCFNMIFNSNHKDGLRKTEDDRRICPLFCAQQTKWDLEEAGMDEHYFVRLWDWFDEGGSANILHHLRTFDIPEKYDFTKLARTAPNTTSTEEAISAGLGNLEQEILDVINSDKPGFKGGWVSSMALDKLIKDSGVRHVAKNRRKQVLSNLGYEWHPGLPDGRMSTRLSDGTRPRLYVARGHSARLLTDIPLIATLYEQAQKT